MGRVRTHYDNLQVKESASPEVIKGAYKHLSQRWHPDKHPNEREKAERILKIINRAYYVLSDPERRKQHDRWIAVERAKSRTTTARQPEDSIRSHPILQRTLIKRGWAKLKSESARSWVAYALVIAFALVILGSAALGWFDNSSTNSRKASDPSRATYRADTSEKKLRVPTKHSQFSKPAQALPSNGTIRYMAASDRSLSRVKAPLKFNTKSGANYLIRLEDAHTHKNILSAFVRGGTSIKIHVPLGTYILKYAAGKTWYGYKYLFGPQTGYSKADSIFHFHRNGNRIRGYEVTLYRVTNGNLHTTQIPPDKF